jgi:2-polyprenyl-3-methyl-5-hydroxy-6-metoxy-1,4-benzoquinol methylase
MKKPIYESNWLESWKLSYHYDLLEFFGNTTNLGYTSAYQRRFNQTIDALKRYVPTGARIIDVAAAQGNFSLRLSELGYLVTWNDLRGELADYVKLKYESGDINYVVGNCFDLDLLGTFDAAIVTEVIEHVAHPNDFLRNIAGLINPGGYIIMTTPNGEYIRNNLPRFSDCPDPSEFEGIQFKPDGDGHIFLLHRDEIEKFARTVGLTLIQLDLFTNPLTAGHLKTSHFLHLIPKPLINAIESLTSSKNGRLFPTINSHTLAVFQKSAN